VEEARRREPVAMAVIEVHDDLCKLLFDKDVVLDGRNMQGHNWRKHDQMDISGTMVWNDFIQPTQLIHEEEGETSHRDW
jgi:hypothetical protein